MTDLTQKNNELKNLENTSQVSSDSEGGVSDSESAQVDDSDFVVDMFDQLANVDFEEAGEVVDSKQLVPSESPSPAANSTSNTASSGEGSQQPQVTPQHTTESVVPAAPVTKVEVTTDPNATPVQGLPADQQAVVPENPQESPLTVLQREVEKNKDIFTKALADTVYKLNDDELVRLDTEPDKIIPEMLAKTHVQIVQNVLSTVAQQLPAAISGYLQAEKEQTRLEDAFFNAWPQLDRTKDKAVVMQFASAYRSANPKATFAEMTKIVGAQALVALNKFQAAAPTPVQNAPKTSVGNSAFLPAASGSRAPSPAATPSVWENISANLLDDFD